MSNGAISAVIQMVIAARSGRSLKDRETPIHQPAESLSNRNQFFNSS
ncbi:hypothetical protein NIES2104_07870 [Leptolyngbya sp. NIES-2104]|nr:hypothetical protein NIES2104_07870 [Leptolyngbya sp. NIES-2104]